MRSDASSIPDSPKGKLAIEIRKRLTTAYLNINVMLQELSDMGVELVLNEFGSGILRRSPPSWSFRSTR